MSMNSWMRPLRSAEPSSAATGRTGTDKDWFEVGGGLTVSTGSVDLSVGAETTIARKDVSYQSYRGTVTFHF